MATQTTRSNEQQSQQSQGQVTTSGSRQGQGGFALGIPLAPADFFRMNPFSLLRRVSEEMDRVIGETGGRELAPKAWAPTIEVTQREGAYVVRAELPGLKPEDVKLEITDDAIVIQGERKVEHEEDKGGLHVTERRYGRFYRAIPLPENAKTDDARASFENGVLEITVPMEEQRSKRREIPIQGSSPTAKPEISTGTAGASDKAA